MSIQPRVHQLVRQHVTSDIFSLLSEEERSEWANTLKRDQDRRIVAVAS